MYCSYPSKALHLPSTSLSMIVLPSQPKVKTNCGAFTYLFAVPYIVIATKCHKKLNILTYLETTKNTTTRY